MRTWLLFFLIAFAMPVATRAASTGEIVIVPLHGQVSEAQFFFLRRALKNAEREKAAAVIIDMDTPGGSLSVAIKMMDALFATSVPTMTYVNPNAGSAGSLIALSTRKIYMAPVSAIGAAAPVLSTGGEIPETMNDKVVSYYSKYFRSAAERYGYNPDVAEAFVNKNKEIKFGDRVLSEKGSILTLSAQEAVMEIDGKPLLAAGIAESVEEVARDEGLEGPLVRVEPTGFEVLAFWLTALAPLFLMAGIVGAYIELKTPGFGIPGMVSAFCFLVFFTGHFLAGLAGFEVLAFFVIGLLLVLIEIIFFPGVAILAVTGVALMIGTLVWTMIDRYPNQPIMPTADMLVPPIVNLLIAGGLGILAILLLARVLPKTTLYRRLVLAAASSPGASGLPVGAADGISWVGRTALAVTDLHPAGKIDLEGTLFDVVTQGEYVRRNTPVRIVARDGMRIVVEASGGG